MTNRDHDHDDIHPPTFDPDDPNPLGPRPAWMPPVPAEYLPGASTTPDTDVPE